MGLLSVARAACQVKGVYLLALAAGFFLWGCGEAQDATSTVDSTSIYGSWDLVELDGQAPQLLGDRGDPTVFIGIAPALNEDERRAGYLQFSGFSGCNYFGGSYSLEGERFEAMNLDSELMGCEDQIERQAEVLFDLFIGGATIEAVDWQLSMAGEDGAMARFRRSEVSEGDGVYRLESIDGEMVESNASLSVRGDSFSAFAGCAVDGNLFRDGAILSFGAPVSVGSRTTTIPEGYDGGSLPEAAPVEALFGCNRSNGPEAAMLEALNGGQGVVTGDLLTITSGSGGVVALRHA